MSQIRDHAVAMHDYAPSGEDNPSAITSWHSTKHSALGVRAGHSVGYLGITPQGPAALEAAALSILPRYVIQHRHGWTFAIGTTNALIVAVLNQLEDVKPGMVWEALPIDLLQESYLVIDPMGRAHKNRGGSSVPVERGTSPATNDTLPPKPQALNDLDHALEDRVAAGYLATFLAGRVSEGPVLHLDAKPLTLTANVMGVPITITIGEGS